MSRALSPTELHSHISFLTLDKNSLRARRLFHQSPDRESIPGPPSYQDGALPLSYRGNEIRLYQQMVKRQNQCTRLWLTSLCQYFSDSTRSVSWLLTSALFSSGRVVLGQNHHPASLESRRI